MLPGTPACLEPADIEAKTALRQQSAALGRVLPLDQLVQTLQLSPFEQEAVLLCAAPELDRSFERIYAYILDDLNRRSPCVELLCSLTASSLAERVARRHALSRFGRLPPHRHPPGIWRARHGTASGTPSGARAVRFPHRCGGEMASLFRDPDEVMIPEGLELPLRVDRAIMHRLGQLQGTP